MPVTGVCQSVDSLKIPDFFYLNLSKEPSVHFSSLVDSILKVEHRTCIIKIVEEGDFQMHCHYWMIFADSAGLHYEHNGIKNSQLINRREFESITKLVTRSHVSYAAVDVGRSTGFVSYFYFAIKNGTIIQSLVTTVRATEMKPSTTDKQLQIFKDYESLLLTYK